KEDLAPAEMAALTPLLQLHSDGNLRVVTSQLTRTEMESWKSPQRSPAERVFLLLQKVEFVQDHTLRGFNNQWGPMGGASCPMIEDDPVSSALWKIGLDRTDAHHVMLAIRERCNYFITCDRKSILKYRASIEAQFPPLRVLKPSELLAELTAASGT